MEIIVCMIVKAAAVTRVATGKYYIHTTPSTLSPFYITTQAWSIAINQYSISMFQMRFMSISSCVVINPFSLNLKLLSPVMDHVTVLFVGIYIYIFEYVNFNNIVIVIVIIVLSVLYDYEHLHVAWCYWTVRS